MKFGDRKFNKKLSRSIDDFEKMLREMEELGGMDPVAVQRWIVDSCLKSLPDDEELDQEILDMLGEQAEYLASELQDQLATAATAGSSWLARLDQLQAEAKEKFKKK